MRFWFLILLCGGLLPATFAEATEFREHNYGFRCVMPDEFRQLRASNTSPYAIMSFAGEKRSETDALVIEFKHMKMTVSEADCHLTAASFAKTEGKIYTDAEALQWKGLTTSVIRTEYVPPNQYHMVDYMVTYPLPKEAVQLHVNGLFERDAEIQKLFYEVAASFESLRPLPPLASSTPAAPKPPGPRRVSYTLYDQIRMFFEKVPPVGLAAAGVLVVAVIAGVVMLKKR